MSEVLEKFLRYVKIDTQSDEESGTSPSTSKQFELADLLYREMLDLGLEDVFYDKEHCYLYGKLPATEGKEGLPCLGFISHI